MPCLGPQISLPCTCSLYQGSRVEKPLRVPDMPGTKSHMKLCGPLSGGLEQCTSFCDRVCEAVIDRVQDLRAEREGAWGQLLIVRSS